MKTIRMSREQMEKRIARFAGLKPLPIQNPSIPEKARDVVYSRKLLSVIGLERNAHTPINAEAPIVGAAGMTMTLAVCPPGQGPGLHSHRQTYETFTVLQGRFEVRWNDDGAENALLERFDTVSFPPGVCRAFRNVGSEEGILQVLITGGVHDMTDIAFSEKARREIEAVRPGLAAEFEKAGFTFDAGEGAP
jgi:quercetin dioxygenase-like cupin family protein